MVGVCKTISMHSPRPRFQFQRAAQMLLHFNTKHSPLFYILTPFSIPFHLTISFLLFSSILQLWRPELYWRFCYVLLLVGRALSCMSGARSGKKLSNADSTGFDRCHHRVVSSLREASLSFGMKLRKTFNVLELLPLETS